MPGIFNIGNTYNVNNKRISSKLTFNTGEKFSGKIIKNEGSNEATIRLIDGWEFQAEIDGNLDSLGKGFTRFQVEGFENGKLKLKIIGENIKDDELNEGEFNEIILKEGLSKEDLTLLKDMVKFNIPLTKENIREIKGIIQFLNKINEDENEAKDFISKYLSSKNIDVDTLEGNKISKVLKEFLVEFKTLSKEDILLFFENNIELNKENIKGFNEIFKSENNITKIINEMGSSVKGLTTSNLEDRKNTVYNINEKVIEENIDEFIYGNESLEDIKGKDFINLENKIGNVAYKKSEENSKVSLLSILKSISGKPEDYINIELKNILLNRKNEFTSSEFERTFNFISKLKPEEFIKFLNDFILDFKESEELPIDKESSKYLIKENNEIFKRNETLNFTKFEVEKVLSKFMGKEIKLTEIEFNELNDGINLKYKEINEKESSMKETVDSEKIDITKENIKEINSVNKNDKELNTKEIIKDFI
ncbi:hypothetical protein H9660_12985, partial [Clostridium sp. Sa3CUN1]